MAKFKIGDNCKIIDIAEGFYHTDKIGQIVEIKNVLDLPDMPQYETTAGFGNICENRLQFVDKYQVIHEKTVKIFVDCEGNEHATRKLAQENNKKIEFFNYLGNVNVFGDVTDFIENIERHTKAVLKFLS